MEWVHELNYTILRIPHNHFSSLTLSLNGLVDRIVIMQRGIYTCTHTHTAGEVFKNGIVFYFKVHRV